MIDVATRDASNRPSLSLSELDDRVLLARLKDLVRRDTALTATLLEHLGEVDVRRLFEGEGFPTLFAYCTGGLGFSEGETYKRTQAARLCRRVPEVLAAVADGRLHLSGVCALAPHFTRENALALIDENSRRPKRAIQAFVDELNRKAKATTPAPPEPSPRQPALDFTSGSLDRGEIARPADTSRPSGTSTPPATATPAALLPVSPTPPPPPERRPLTVRATPALFGKLDRALALMSHAPGGRDTAVVLERALDLLIKNLETARFGAPKRTPRPNPTIATPAAPAAPAAPAVPTAPPTGQAPEPPTGAAKDRRSERECRDHIPMATRREVYDRDQGRCTFVGTGGHRCGSDFDIELHHIVAWARGGTDEPGNLTLHCHTHNQFQAERDGLARFAPPHLRCRVTKGPAST